jgi:ribosome maturation factor RimP
MRRADDNLARLIGSVVEPMGYELVGIELFQRSQHGSVLRVYIDRGEGITLDDCSAVSHQLSGVLDVEDPIRGHYDLEVSSPGLDRPLFTREHFERFRGCRARLKLMGKLEGRRKYEGRLMGLDGNSVLIQDNGEQQAVPLELIDSARLVPDI